MKHFLRISSVWLSKLSNPSCLTSGLRVVVLCTARPGPGSGRAPAAWLLSSQDFPHQPSTSPLPGSHHLFINLNHSAFNAHLNLDFRHVKSYTRDKWEESIYIFILSISTNVCSHVCCCCFPGPGAGVVMVMTSGGGALGTLLPANLNLQQPITLTFIFIFIECGKSAATSYEWNKEFINI